MALEAFIPRLYEITSSISIFLALILIVVIVTKTPSFMKTYKRYLLIYTIQSLLLELSCEIYSPDMLHPYAIFYPLGIAKHLPRKLSMSIFAMQYYHAMSLYDCTIALILVRFYAMKNISNTPSKIPIYAFSFFAGLSFCYLIFVLTVIFYPPLNEIFFISPEENLNNIQKLYGTTINNNNSDIGIESLIGFRHNLEANSLPPLMIILTVLIGTRLLIIFILLILNALLSQKLKPIMSENHLKNHKMLLQMIVLQFIGILVILAFPILMIIIASLFFSKPSQIISLCFTLMNCFGIYDTIITIICIKPYRMVFVNCFKNGLRKNVFLQKIKQSF